MIKDNTEEIVQSDINVQKINQHKNKYQEFWGTIKKPNLRIHGEEKGSEIQTKGIENLPSQ
jgi:hypothetical protein